MGLIFECEKLNNHVLNCDSKFNKVGVSISLGKEKSEKSRNTRPLFWFCELLLAIESGGEPKSKSRNL